jgi:iron complex transport system substrate-binding protein
MVNCVRNRQVFEIQSANILQPGPAALTDGLDQIKSIIDDWYEGVSDSD